MTSQQEEHLAECHRHIAEFELRVGEQEARVAQLERDGHATEDALRLLQTFLEPLRLAIGHRELILREMSGDLRWR